MPPFRRICVFCASSDGHRPEYRTAARELGGLLGRRGIGLVYGGAHVGLMGAMADAVLAAGGQVTGVMPQALVDREVAHRGLTEFHVVRSMHERKALMADLADGFIALPGGFGTLDEFCEILTWAQLGLHHKPCGLLNVLGFYDGFLRLLDHAVAEGLLGAENRALAMDSADAEDLLEAMGAFLPSPTRQWIRRVES